MNNIFPSIFMVPSSSSPTSNNFFIIIHCREKTYSLGPNLRVFKLKLKCFLFFIGVQNFEKMMDFSYFIQKA